MFVKIFLYMYKQKQKDWQKSVCSVNTLFSFV